MQNFSGTEYVKIAMANALGHDKSTWKERLDIINFGFIGPDLLAITNASNMVNNYDYQAAAIAYNQAINGEPSGYLCQLDATSQVFQIMSLLAHCETGLKNCNMIPVYDDKGEAVRVDSYKLVTDTMKLKGFSGISHSTGLPVTHEEIKECAMTAPYGSKRNAGSLFGYKTKDNDIFWETLFELFPGAMTVSQMLIDSWSSTATHYKWTMPDEHTCFVPVTEAVTYTTTLEEYGNIPIQYRTYEQCAVEKGVSLAANVIQSIDGYIVRRMTKLSQQLGIELITNHDGFFAHPNNMNTVRTLYTEACMQVAGTNIVDIISEYLHKPNTDFASTTYSMAGNYIEFGSSYKSVVKKIADNEYAIC